MQRSFVKFWADDTGKVRCKHGDKYTDFDIESSARYHPIAALDFYSKEIEEGMNQIEDDGLVAIKLVNGFMKSGKDIALKEHNLMALRFYFLLTTRRSQWARESLASLTGDALFNMLFKESGDSPQKYQEEQIKELIVLYKDYKDNGNSTSPEFLFKQFLKSPDVGKAQILETITSDLFFFLFHRGELFATETGGFQEIKEGSSCVAVYNFMPLGPKFGCMFCIEPFFGLNKYAKSTRKSEIFPYSDLSEKPKIHYDNNCAVDRNGFKDLSKPVKSSKNDSYRYKTQEIHDLSTTDACNAMVLVNKETDSFIFYKKIEAFDRADNERIKRKIVKIEY